MSDADEVTERRRNLALKIFAEHPGKISADMQEKILSQKVVLGMTPYEAYLAGGAFAFRVIADQSKWPKNSDPYNVMWAQSTAPDNSQIWMTFENFTQDEKEEKTKFRVFFEGGRAMAIESLAG